MKGFFKLDNKKFKHIGLSLLGAGFTAVYFHKKHKYDREMFERLAYLLDNNIKLSGIKLQERPAFGFIGWLQWLIPYHQSLTIPRQGQSLTIPRQGSSIIDKFNDVRHIGLGSIKGLLSGFVSHQKPKYLLLNRQDIQTPIECWVTYKRIYGHFPGELGPIDIDILNELTLTQEEYDALPDDKKNDKNIKVFTTRFGSLIKVNGKWTISTCRSSILTVLREAEIKSLEKRK